MSGRRDQGWIVAVGALAAVIVISRIPRRPEPIQEVEVGRVAAPAASEHAVSQVSPTVSFDAWLSAYESSEPSRKRELLPAGIAAAKSRRAQMLEWIVHDPRRALENRLTEAQRAALPPEIVAEVEETISGEGSLIEQCAMRADGNGEVFHEARVGARAFTAHLYGRREGFRSARHLSLFGIALDGQLAVYDSPVHMVAVDGDGSVTMEAFGGRRTVSSRLEAYALEAQLQREETAASTGSVITSHQEDESDGCPTLGEKAFLVLRVDFPDVTGALADTPETSTFFDDVADFYHDNSYGKLEIDFTVDDAVLRMPYTSAEYVDERGPSGLLDDALDAVSDRYDAADFDCVVLLFPNIAPDHPGNFYWAGLGGLGTVWINGELRKDVVCHEIGHHFGVGHASAWVPADENPLCRKGSSLIYGDNADVMATTADGIPGHFNPVFKHRMHWLGQEAITSVRESGVYRIWRYDDPDADISRPVALELFRGQRNLWISFRQQAFTNLPDYGTGATVLRASLDGYRVEILDMNTPGVTTYDSPMQPGETLRDPDYGVTITALARSGTGADEHMDFEITVEPLPANILVDYGSTTPVVDEDTFGVRRFSAGVLTSLSVLDDGSLHLGGLTSWARLLSVPDEIGRVLTVDARADLHGLGAAVDVSGRAFVWGTNSSLVEAVPNNVLAARDIEASGSKISVLGLNGQVAVYGGSDYASASAENPMTDVVQVAASDAATVYLLRDGTVRSPDVPELNEAAALTDLVQIAVSDQHLLGLRADGTVVGFGWDGDSYGEATPPEDLTKVRQIAADQYASAALTEDGRLVRWGDERLSNPLPDRPIAAMDIRQNHLVLLVNNGEPHVTLEPRSVPFVAGGIESFTTLATGAEALSYHWQMRRAGWLDWLELSDDSSFAGSKTVQLTVKATDAVVAGDSFRCVVIDAQGRSTVSMAAALMPEKVAAPQISGVDHLLASESTTLVCSFDAAASLQWYRDGVAIDGANGTTLTIDGSLDDAAGSYSVRATTPFGVFTTESTIELTVENPPAAAAPVGRLVNFSVRATAGHASESLICGFVIKGATNKNVLVRAIGPSLASFGVGNVLADPGLSLEDAGGRMLRTNDNWNEGADGDTIADAMAEVGAFAVSPESPDAAILADLEPGIYTAMASDSEAEGVALIDIYERDNMLDTRLVNLSTRAHVGAGGEVLIGGLVVEGGSLPVLVRGVGASLADRGVADVLANPELSIYRNGEEIARNDSWLESEAEIEEVQSRVGAFELLSDDDAAILLTLDPGAYTVCLRGVGGTTGVGLIEVYDAR